MPAAAKIRTTKSSEKPRLKEAAGRTKAARTERNCSVARTLDIVSDAWAFLIIREAFFGTQTFEAFRSALGIPRATLTDRLKKLTQLAIFRQVAPGSSRRKEYRLTKMGFDLYPSFIALMQFGDRWLAKGKAPPLTLVHTSCGCDSYPIVTCSHCGESVSGARPNTGMARAPDDLPPGRGSTPGGPLTETGSPSAARARCRARWRSSATNGASWSFAKASSAIAATTRS